MRYLISPAGWSPEEQNPFSGDGTYAGWSCLSLSNEEEGGFFTGRSRAGCWMLRLGQKVPDRRQMMVDFIRYENGHGRTVIVQSGTDSLAQEVVADAEADSFPPEGCRPSDPQYVVHSTTLESWKLIEESGELRAESVAHSRRYGATPEPSNEVERYILAEPPEYREYVMLAPLGTAAPERVLASHQTGRFVADDEVGYVPGVRVYLDNRRIIQEGLGTRDGVHATKVHLRLPLAPYMIMSVKAVEAPEGAGRWTPRLYTKDADERFLQQLSGGR